MIENGTIPETLQDEALDQIQGAGPAGDGDQGKTTLDSGNAAVSAWWNATLSANKKPRSAPEE